MFHDDKECIYHFPILLWFEDLKKRYHQINQNISQILNRKSPFLFFITFPIKIKLLSIKAILLNKTRINTKKNYIIVCKNIEIYTLTK